MHLRQKFALLIAAMALPAVLVTAFYLSQSNQAVRTARNELDGARYMQSVGSLLARVTRHRTVSNALLSGDTTGRPELGRLEDYIQGQIEQLNPLDAELGGRFGTTASWRELTEQWAQIKSSAGTQGRRRLIEPPVMPVQHRDQRHEGDRQRHHRVADDQAQIGRHQPQMREQVEQRHRGDDARHHHRPEEQREHQPRP